MGLYCLVDAIRSLNITAPAYEKKHDTEMSRYERYLLDWGILWLGINMICLLDINILIYLCLAYPEACFLQYN